MTLIDIRTNEFDSYGVVINPSQISETSREKLMTLMINRTSIPIEGNIYVADFEPVNQLGIRDEFEKLVGGSALQFGYCHGQNQKVNALEWHDGEEIILAVSPCVLFLGLPEDLVVTNGCYEYDTNKLIAIELAKGDLIKLKTMILHFSPVKTVEEGFRTMIILPKGTNTPLEAAVKDPYVFMTNKWLIAHRDRSDLVDKGAHYGLVGENYDWSKIS